MQATGNWYSLLSSWLWTVAYAHTVHSAVHYSRHSRGDCCARAGCLGHEYTAESCYHWMCWGVPLLAVVIALTSGALHGLLPPPLPPPSPCMRVLRSWPSADATKGLACVASRERRAPCCAGLFGKGDNDSTICAFRESRWALAFFSVMWVAVCYNCCVYVRVLRIVSRAVDAGNDVLDPAASLAISRRVEALGGKSWACGDGRTVWAWNVAL